MAKKAERFSADQDLLEKSIKDLFKFYYSSDFSKSKGEWLWDPLYEATKKVATFYGYESETNYDKDKKCLTIEYRRKDEDENKEKDRHIEDAFSCHCKVKSAHIKQFNKLMTNLLEEIEKKSFVHIEFVGITDKLKTELKTFESNMADGRTNDDSSKKTPFSSSHEKNVMRKGLLLLDKAIMKTIGGHLLHLHAEKGYYRADVSHERSFRLKPITDFGNQLLRTKKPNIIMRVYPLASPKITTLRRLLFYIFIHFHLVFGGFDRIKICQFCGHLYFEKKKGAGMYCSTRCKGKANAQKNRDEKTLCRNRQNAWATDGSRTIELDPVKKLDCRNCDIYLNKLKGGSCPELKKQVNYEKASKKRPRIEH